MAATSRRTDARLTRALAIVSKHDAKEDARITRVEQAIVQINHFTESVEKLDLPAWKSEVSADLRWLKLILGATGLAAIGQLAVTLLRGPQ